MRYKIWRSNVAPQVSAYVLVFADPPEGPETNWQRVPEAIRRLGFWIGGGGEGRVSRLRPAYRDLLLLQGFVVLARLPCPGELEKPPRRRVRLRAGRFSPISSR